MKVNLTHAPAKTVAAAALNPATKSKLISEAVKEVKAAVGPKVASMLKNFGLVALPSSVGQGPKLQQLTFTYDPKNLKVIGEQLGQFCNYEVQPIVIDGKDWYLGDGDDLHAVAFGTKEDDTPFANAPKGVGKIWLRQLDYDDALKNELSPRKSRANVGVKATKAAGDNKLPKTLQLLKTLNANSFGAEWNKEADTVRVWATGTQRPMQFRIVGQLDKAIKEDTGAKAVRVMPNTSWKPNSLELNGKLEKRD